MYPRIGVREPIPEQCARSIQPFDDAHFAHHDAIDVAENARGSVEQRILCFQPGHQGADSGRNDSHVVIGNIIGGAGGVALTYRLAYGPMK